MFALQVIWFYLLMLTIPLGIGGLFFPTRSMISPVCYLAGLATAWGTYEIIGLPCALLFKTSLTTLTVLWSAVMILLTVAGILVRYTHGQMALLPAKGLQLSRTTRILLALVIVMVVLQTADRKSTRLNSSH